MSELITNTLSDTTEDLQNDEEGHRLKEQYIRMRLEDGPGLYSTEQIKNPDDAKRIMAKALSTMDREYVCVINLNTQNQPIGYSVVAMGTIDATLVEQGNIFKTAMLSNAAGIMVMHNHPSGNLKPSEEDLKLTARINTIAQLFGIDFLDHIVVGSKGNTYSIRAHYPDLFSGESMDVLNNWVDKKEKKIERSI